MKRKIHFPRILGTLLTALLVLASCHDDDSSMMDTSAMLNQSLVPTTYSFMWNGSLKEHRTDVCAVFYAIDGKTDQMQMNISGIIPSVDEEQTLLVDVSPQTDEVQYAGQFTDSRYELTVNGSWFPYENGNYFKLKCTYKILDGLVFDEPSEWVPNHTVEKNNQRIFLTFKDDASLDIEVEKTEEGKVTMSSLATVSFWFSKQEDKVIIDLTETQASSLAAKWLEITGDDLFDNMQRYKEFNRYALYLNVKKSENNNNLVRL